MLSSHCDNMLLPYSAGARRAAALVDHHRRYRPNAEVAPSCPRCDSPNTKFCYYNNYSLSQPRYFCKGCRRYWTKGGSLRNVPVGGGCRKNRRSGGKTSVRAMAVDDAIAGSGAGTAAFSHRIVPCTVRPDLILEGMVGGNRAGLCQPIMPAAGDDKQAAGGAPAIDLALLYAKFLNQQPPVGPDQQCAVVPESVDTCLSGSSDVPPDQSFTSQDGFGELSSVSGTASSEPGAVRCPDAGELSFSVDQSCYDSLGLSTDDGDLVLPSTWHRPAKYEPFDALPEDAMSLHDGSISDAGGDDVWSNALACQGLEAALCRP